MITCKQVAYLLTSGEIDNQSRWGKAKVRFHLWMCRHCSQLARQLQQIRQAGLNLRSKFESEHPTRGPGLLEERILNGLKSPPPDRPPEA